ncbi:hypothetical protein MAR_011720 [Mya arenaria]|uniref:Uncharacterized protein n=1 Tax=Mya arenaria TaxID=6604 RepID=A0ABY7FZ46_MYAAR|nr:hypothetical protein MAR_011720 [Mya arenaria]
MNDKLVRELWSSECTIQIKTVYSVDEDRQFKLSDQEKLSYVQAFVYEILHFSPIASLQGVGTSEERTISSVQNEGTNIDKSQPFETPPELFHVHWKESSDNCCEDMIFVSAYGIVASQASDAIKVDKAIQSGIFSMKKSNKYLCCFGFVFLQSGADVVYRSAVHKVLRKGIRISYGLSTMVMCWSNMLKCVYCFMEIGKSLIFPPILKRFPGQVIEHRCYSVIIRVVFGDESGVGLYQGLEYRVI